MNLGKPGPFNFSMPVTWFMLALKESKKKPSLKKLVQKKKLLPKTCLFPSRWLRNQVVQSCCLPRLGVNRRKPLCSWNVVLLGRALLRREQHGVCFSVFRCFLKLGEWQLNLQGINESTIPKVLQYYSAATEHDRSWYKVTGDGSEPGFPLLLPDAGQCSCVTAEPRWPGLVP